jgi:CRP-like cAMP-binding protein
VAEPVEAIVVSAPAFRQLLRENGSLAYSMLESVVLKLQQATQRRIGARSGDALGEAALV